MSVNTRKGEREREREREGEGGRERERERTREGEEGGERATGRLIPPSLQRTASCGRLVHGKQLRVRRKAREIIKRWRKKLMRRGWRSHAYVDWRSGI